MSKVWLVATARSEADLAFLGKSDALRTCELDVTARAILQIAAASALAARAEEDA
jgi:sulfur transfer protein SufE